MFQFQSKDPKISLACAIAYWCFTCRDKNKSPAMGIDTWTYFQSSISNAAIPSNGLNDFIENLCKKLVVPHLNPIVFGRIIDPAQRIQRLNVETGEIMEFDSDQGKEKLKWLGWEEILESLKPQGITARHILSTYKDYPHVVIALIRLRHEEEKELKQALLDDEGVIDV